MAHKTLKKDSKRAAKEQKHSPISSPRKALAIDIYWCLKPNPKLFLVAESQATSLTSQPVQICYYFRSRSTEQRVNQ